MYADFEHAFLYDGERQLKIKYNPKVSSFKNDILESKTDTIGGQFPFIFRNGNVKYKEFPISGLISCLLDEENLFMDKENLGQHDLSSNLISENIASEREFKLEVLEWLNNGQPKLFRSPTEGNYIVRLMNVSLAPNDTLGRMLHTFTATAYEIAECTYDNLSKLNLISLGDPTVAQLRWETVLLDRAVNDNLLKYNAVALYFEGMAPGEKIYIDDGIKRPKEYDDEGRVLSYAIGFEVTIGVTGSYILDLTTGATIKAVKLINAATSDYIYHQGSLTYAYYSKILNRFDLIADVDIIDVPL